MIKQIPLASNLSMDYSLRDMVTSDGSWNLEFFCLWCIEDIIARFVSIPPLHHLQDRIGFYGGVL